MKIKSFNSFKEIKENKETENYMFFANLDHICRMMQEMKNMPHDKMDALLKEHDWASDHISRSFESVSHVYNFFLSMMNSKENEIVSEAIEVSNREKEVLLKRNQDILNTKAKSVLLGKENETEHAPKITLKDNYLSYIIIIGKDTYLSLEVYKKDDVYLSIYMLEKFMDMVKDKENLVFDISDIFNESSEYVDFLTQKNILNIERILRYNLRKGEHVNKEFKI